MVLLGEEAASTRAMADFVEGRDDAAVRLALSVTPFVIFVPNNSLSCVKVLKCLLAPWKISLVAWYLP